MNNLNTPVKLFLTDVDGCLTDGGLYYAADGNELKRFCVYDGMGMACLQKAGIPCGIITSETIDVVRIRARKLSLRYLYMGVGRVIDRTPALRFAPATAEPVELQPMTKREAAQHICDELGITLADVCYVGDDINDLDLLRAVGHPCCPSTARPEVRAVPGIRILRTPGGQGAIRELTDDILASL
ncbi:MAG: HAD hydrolase family protein [Paludibacteraceae bacterium]|nr:HAD hydrolase family protein [Paludibacteraceae bacterium]MBR1481067.1 HAD hydrolase family protein [Paludibacteraceae bacterium]